MNYFQLLNDEFIPPLYQNNAHSMYYYLITFKTVSLSKLVYQKINSQYDIICFYVYNNKLKILHFLNHKTIELDFNQKQIKEQFAFVVGKSSIFNNQNQQLKLEL